MIGATIIALICASIAAGLLWSWWWLAVPVTVIVMVLWVARRMPPEDGFDNPPGR